MQPPDPPIPISATFSTGTGLTTITFDQPLQPGPVAGPNWLGAITSPPLGKDLDYLAPLTAAAATVSGVAFTSIPATRPLDTISYAAAPPDVISAKGIPAAPFTNFPLQTIP